MVAVAVAETVAETAIVSFVGLKLVVAEADVVVVAVVVAEAVAAVAVNCTNKEAVVGVVVGVVTVTVPVG